MKRLFWITVIALFASCKSGFEHNKAGFEKLGSELVAKFGKEAYYTHIGISSHRNMDDMVEVSVTKDPGSMKQEQWLLYQGGEWEKQADVSFTVEGGTPESYMFRLHKEADLSRLGQLLEQSVTSMQKEYHVAKPTFVMASIHADQVKKGAAESIFYYITLLHPDAQKGYIFKYDRDGNLVNKPDNPGTAVN